MFSALISRFNSLQRQSIYSAWLSLYFVTALLVAVFSPLGSRCQILKRIEYAGHAQGTTWHLTYYASDSLVEQYQIDSILVVIDSSVSLYKPFSKIVEFNISKAGIKIDQHFRKIVEKSLELYHETGGVFDITVLPLVEAWGFATKHITELPDSDVINSLLPCVSSGYLHLENDFLGKSRPCTRIDLNGIAQGYSVDVIADFLKAKGIQNYIMELGGELRIQGRRQPGDQPFVVSIEAPSDNDFQINPLETLLVVDSGGITTSGNYRSYYNSQGKRISHLINPLTGYPFDNELISVTVYAKDAITADGLDNSLMGMGLQRAQAFVEARNDIGAYFIYHLPDGRIRHWTSSRFRRLIKK